MTYEQGKRNSNLVVTIADGEGTVLAQYKLADYIADAAAEWPRDGADGHHAVGRDDWRQAVSDDAYRYANGDIPR